MTGYTTQDGETYSTDGPKCPHCGHVQTPDEAFYFDGRRYEKDTCGNCDRPYLVEVEHSTSWTCRPVPRASSSNAA